MSNETTTTSTNASTLSQAYVTTAYVEVCRSHQALADFRMKLLGLLPIASIVGLLALGKSAAPDSVQAVGPEVLGYIGVFSALFTLALFGYEIRGILMCHDLSATGVDLEKLMGMEGQFRSCDETRQLPCYAGAVKRRLARKINGKIMPCAVYSLVFAAWFFVGLRWGLEVHLEKCVWWAASLGIVLAVVTSLLLHVLTKEPIREQAASPEATVEIAAV